MKKLLFVALLVCGVSFSATAQEHNTLTKKERKAGWQLLWNGEDLTGWKSNSEKGDMNKGWKAVDGELIIMARSGAGDIITEKRYHDFELSIDFKITEGANSGIKYFIGENGSVGCEFQILDDNNHPDAKLGVNGNRKLASLYDLIPAPVDKGFRGGFFNTAHIKVNGNHVEHWLNHVKVLEYDRNNQMWDALVNYSKYKVWPGFGNAEEGHILLQDHGDEVWFKNIKIKVLP